MRAGLCACLLAAALPLGCGPGPGSADAGPARIGPIDFMRFVQDRPAIGGDWYLYDEAGGHVLSPLPHAYLVRAGSGDDARYGALRVVTYYDVDTAESGRFTVAFRTFSASEPGGWSAEQTHVASRDVKGGDAVCLDLFSAAERPCGGEEWQVQLRTYAFLAREGPIVVNRPGVFVRSVDGIAAGGDVFVATLEGRSNLDGLPDPRNLPDLDDGAAHSWSRTSYDLSAFAANLPQAGMVLGERLLSSEGSPDALFLVDAGRNLVRFSLALDDDGRLGVRYGSSPVELLDNTVPDEEPALKDVEVLAPAPGEIVRLAFEEPGLVVREDDAVPFHLPVRESRWDLALLGLDDGRLRVLVSPGAALYNATRLGDGETDLATAEPPLAP